MKRRTEGLTTMQHMQLDHGTNVNTKYLADALHHALGWEIAEVLNVHISHDPSIQGVRVISGLPKAANDAIAAEIARFLRDE